MSRRPFAPLLAGLVLLHVGPLVLPALAQGQDEPAVAVRGSAFAEDGTTTIQVNVSGVTGDEPIPAGAFAVTENGEPVEDLEVSTLEDTGEVDVAAVLAIDASTSMAGELLDSIKVASNDLVDTLTSQDIAVGLIEFETLATLLAAPTTDAGELAAEIEGIEATGSTALYDAVLLGVEALQGREGIGELIVLADGEDNISTSTLDDAITAAVDAEVPVTVIAYETELFEPDVLLPLAEESDGRFVTAQEADEFAAIFAELAEDVASQYTLSYTSTLVEPAELDLAIQVDVDGATAATEFVIANPRSASAVPGQGPQAAELPDSGIFGESWALYLSLAIVFAGSLLFLFVLLVPRGDRQASRTLRRGLTVAERSGSSAPRPGNAVSASALGQRAVELISRVPRPEGYDDRLQNEIDRAGWQMRSSEFTAMRVGAAVASLALVWALSGSVVLGLFGLAFGAFAPVVFLSSAKSRRQAKFMEQLPDTLQLLSGTLKAGYGILQAIDTIVKEMDDPISSEFQRALTEARLGLPLEDSLQAMADRVESDDFRWVVVAINIQRQIGGNLAELLETVSETLRGREQVRRQIKVLSAEGKLSAYVLIALPFVILGYLTLVNPTYLAPLITEPMGWIMAGIGGFLMVVGVFWMRKLIKIDV